MALGFCSRGNNPPLKQMQGFDGRATKPITYTIYLILTIGIHIESLTSLLIIKLRNHPMIFGQPRMKKHGVIIDITNNSLVFWPSYYTQIRATPSTILSQSRLPVKTAVIKIEKDITFQKMIKKAQKKTQPIFCKC